MNRTGGIARLLLIAMLAAAALAWAAPEARAQDDANKVELVGLIESVQADAITVNGLVVSLTGAEVSATLDVGAAVWVEGVALDDGTIRAIEVAPAEDGVLLPGELEIVGVLDSLASGAAVVNGLTFDLAVAEVQPGLAVGDLVKVHAGLSTGGDWIAREIEPFVPDASTGSADGSSASATAQPHFDDGEFEIVGTLTNAGEGLIVVAGQQIDITGAEMHGTPRLGALVKVHLSLVNGEWVAREVETQFDSHRGQHDSEDRGGSGRNGSDDNSGASSSGSALDDNGSGGHGSDDSPGDDRGGDDHGGDDNGGHGGDDAGGDDHGGDD